jgi:two-component system, NarL family, invasion response regulator UvrY
VSQAIRAEDIQDMPARFSPRVLVVDDIDGSRDLAREVLEHDGIEVAGEADSGEGAIRLAQELRPDVVLMDVRMQGIDGIEATRRLKRIMPDIHVIILSVFDDKALMDEATEAGASAHITKGTAGAQLTARVLSVCGMSSASV